MATLYEINAQIEEAILAMMDSMDEETGEVSEEALARLETLKEERKTKLDNIGAMIKNLQNDINGIETEIEKLHARAVSKQKVIDKLKEMVTADIVAHGEKKVETSRVVYTFKPSDKVEIMDAEKVPERFLKTKVTTTLTPDKTAIKNAIMAGEEVDGCKVVHNYNIQIK